MKTKFFEQYSLTDEKLKEIWESGLVVFDTNILLNLYRYNKQTCDDILNYMQTFGDQLWMPFQVGWSIITTEWRWPTNHRQLVMSYQKDWMKIEPH